MLSSNMTLSRNEKVFVLLFLISITFHVAPAISNFDHNPNCLLMTAQTQLVEYTDFNNLHDDHLSSAHQSGIVIKQLNPNKPSRHFPLWKTCCLEIVIFYDGENINFFYSDLTTWGYQNNVLFTWYFPYMGITPG